MLGRSNRLTKEPEFRHVRRNGRVGRCDLFMVFAVPAETAETTRFGFVVSKKVGNSVVRHRVRRLMQNSARELMDEGFTGWDVVVSARPGLDVSHLEYGSVLHQMRRLLKQTAR